MDAAAELGMNPRHQTSEMETWQDGTEPVSRDQILRHARGQYFFPVREGLYLTRLIHTCYMCDIHTYSTWFEDRPLPLMQPVDFVPLCDHERNLHLTGLCGWLHCVTVTTVVSSSHSLLISCKDNEIEVQINQPSVNQSNHETFKGWYDINSRIITLVVIW